MKNQIQKPTQIKNCLLKKIPEWFGHERSEPIGFHKDVVINQPMLM